MTRIWTFCIVSAALASLALLANAASAEMITPHVNTPTVHFQTPTPKGVSSNGSSKDLQFGVGRGIKSRSGSGEGTGSGPGK
jgi:hypothetical protein